MSASSLEIHFFPYLGNLNTLVMPLCIQKTSYDHCIYWINFFGWLFYYIIHCVTSYLVGNKTSLVWLYYLSLPEPAQRIFSSIFSTHFCQWPKDICGMQTNSNLDKININRDFSVWPLCSWIKRFGVFSCFARTARSSDALGQIYRKDVWGGSVKHLLTSPGKMLLLQPVTSLL